MKNSAACLFCCLLLLACASTQRTEAPSTAVPVDESYGIFRFGEVFEGQTITATFLIRNPSPFYLIIDEVETTCGCTTAQLAGQQLPPNGEILVRVTLQTAHLWGPQSKMVVLHTNSPYRPKIKLLLEGVVRERLQLEPRRISAETDQATYHATVRVTNVTDQAMQIESLTTEPAELVHATLDHQTLPFSLAPGATAIIAVDVQLEHAGAKVAGNVFLHLAGGEDPTQLPVYVERN